MYRLVLSKWLWTYSRGLLSKIVVLCYFSKVCCYTFTVQPELNSIKEFLSFVLKYNEIRRTNKNNFYIGVDHHLNFCTLRLLIFFLLIPILGISGLNISRWNPSCYLQHNSVQVSKNFIKWLFTQLTVYSGCWFQKESLYNLHKSESF